VISTDNYPSDILLGRSGTYTWGITARASNDSYNPDGFGIYDWVVKKYRLKITNSGNILIGHW
jgi:hypothetical protein